MAYKIQRFEKQVNYLWYQAEITEEQALEYKKYLEGEIDEPEWAYNLDFDLIKDKTGNDEHTFELIEE